MTAGDLRDRVCWEKPRRGDTSATGQKLTGYVAAGNTAAKVRPVLKAAGEGDEHAQLTPARGYEVTIRSRTVDVNHDWRLTWQGRGRGQVLNVTAVLPHPAGDDWVLVLCSERPPTTTG